MTDGFPDRLTQLRTRWKNDPSSRIFLQLAEEYRHLGRVQEAYEVLEAGLKEHPGYLSALVAKGRCLLELGDAAGARGVLERVVQQDATQMVANKLLVRAYLETGEPEGARQRLDLYSLLNDSDPEIEELRRRVVAMSRPPRGPDGPHSAEPAERSRMDRTDTPEPPAASAADVFALGTAGLQRHPAAEDDVFGLGPPPAPPLTPHLPPVAAVADEPREAPPAVRARGEGTDGEPFPDLAPEHSHRLYHAALAAEGIFFLGEPAAELAAPEPEAAPGAAETAAPPSAPETAVAPRPVEPATAALAQEPTVAARAVEPRLERPAPELATASQAPAPAAAPQASELAAAPAGALRAAAAAPTAGTASPAEMDAAPAGQPESETASPVIPAIPAGVPPGAAVPERPEPATATLGQLYLRQGHFDEAERIFREVARREPENAAAHQALESLESGRAVQRLDAERLLAGRPGASDPALPTAARKAHLLQSYLTRLRQGRRPHVS